MFRVSFVYLRTAAIWMAMVAAAVLLHRTGSGVTDAPAIVEAREHRVAATEPGRVLQVEVRDGQRVTKGQVLLRVGTEQIDSQIDTVKAQIDRTASAVDAASVGIEADAFTTLRGLNGELEQARAAHAEARAADARERTELAALVAEIEREQALVDQGLARADRLAELTVRRQVLQAAVDTAPARLQSAAARAASAQQNLQQWQTRFAAHSRGADARALQLQPLRDAIQEKEAVLNGLRVRRAESEIRAPVDGQVMALRARPGDVVRPGDPLMIVTQAAAGQVVAYVGESSRRAPAPGAKVVISKRYGGAAPIDGETEIEGEVATVASEVTLFPTRFWRSPSQASWGREVYVKVPEHAALLPGEAVNVRFVDDGRAPPRSATAGPPSPSSSSSSSTSAAPAQR